MIEQHLYMEGDVQRYTPLQEIAGYFHSQYRGRLFFWWQQRWWYAERQEVYFISYTSAQERL